MYEPAELLPSTRDGALRLGLVTLEQMVTALLAAVENPARGIRVASVPEIRAAKAMKSPARSGVRRHPTRGVTSQTKVIA